MMENLIGKITASLLASDSPIPDGLIDKLNGNIHPPEPLAPDDINIRTMYIVSDRVNSYGGCFPADEHLQLINLLIDAPVLVGHRKDSLPIARNFYAEPVARDGANWVKAYFYWLKNSEPGEELRRNIDGGIYKECSISFIFGFPECSICGADIRECRHRPFVTYDTESGEKKEAYFNYRRIEKVLETSLVYRGSVSDTAISKDLAFTKGATAIDKSPATLRKEPIVKRIWDIRLLEPNHKYLVLPAYESIPIILSREKGRFALRDVAGTAIENRRLIDFLHSLSLPEDDFQLSCRIIGCRGKGRQSVEELNKYLQAGKSTVRHLDLKVSDISPAQSETDTYGSFPKRRKRLEQLFVSHPGFLVPVTETDYKNLETAIEKCGTRFGAEIIDIDADEIFLFYFNRLFPAVISEREKHGGQFKYHLTCRYGDKLLPLAEPIVSSRELSDGETVEIETHSLKFVDGCIQLRHPRLCHCLGKSIAPSDISLLCSIPPVLSNDGAYHVSFSSDDDLALTFDDLNGEQTTLFIPCYSSSLLSSGRRFFAEKRNGDCAALHHVAGSGHLLEQRWHGDGAVLGMDGYFRGKFILRPAICCGEHKYLFYRLEIEGAKSR
jgi:hypothetical protein